MTSHNTLQDAITTLGYRTSDGYIDRSAADVGVRGLIWTDLRQKCGVDAAFFKGAVPIVAFSTADSRNDALSTQRRLWNYGRVPVLIAATASEVFALSCHSAGSNDPDAAFLASAGENQDLLQVLADFTRFSIESGRLSERKYTQLDKKNRVDQALLRNLQQLRVMLIRAGVPESDIEPLLGRSIFIRYLEDRGILRAEDLLELNQAESLVAALDSGWAAVNSLFDAMSDHFNGDVFRKDAISQPVGQTALRTLSEFFGAADMASGQQSLWPYDFAIIPPELISSIYEQLLIEKQKSDAAYYTPRHVVDLVLDEVMPADWLYGCNRTLLDPACGSGIFLTEAFRRIVHRHTQGLGATPTFEDLSRLLVDSVFGVDRNADAVGVAAFGLYLALLEHVDPRTAWLRARLPNLIGTNLVVADFFDNHSLSSHRFDAIVGNPPWKSQTSESATRFLERSDRQVPDRQIAAAFVWRSVELLKDDGVVGLVLPSKTILHNRGTAADRFRLQFFSNLNVYTIIDLSPLRRELFGAASSPAAIVIFNHDESRSDTMLHVSPRRTPVAQIADAIAIPQQNIRRIPRATTETDPAIWKPLLWGGPRDVDLVRHLRESFTSLQATAKKNRWYDGQGFQEKGGAKNDATHIADFPHLPTAELQALRLPANFSDPVDKPSMHRPRRVEIYRAPHVLMRKGFKEFPEAAFIPYAATFTDGLSAVAADESSAPQLRAISAILNSSVARYWYLMTSSSWGVEREQLHHREWMSLPIPPLTYQQSEDLLAVVESAAAGQPERTWRATLDRTVENAYGLTNSEREVVEDALTVRLPEFRSGWRSFSYRPPNDDHMLAYAGRLQAQLKDLDLGRWGVSLTERSHGFAMVTCKLSAGDRDVDLIDTRFSIEQLISESARQSDIWLSSVPIIEPEALVLDGTAVHLVKPDRLSCWTISCTQDDAARIFSALLTGDVSSNADLDVHA